MYMQGFFKDPLHILLYNFYFFLYGIAKDTILVTVVKIKT